MRRVRQLHAVKDVRRASRKSESVGRKACGGAAERGGVEHDLRAGGEVERSGEHGRRRLADADNPARAGGKTGDDRLKDGVGARHGVRGKLLVAENALPDAHLVIARNRIHVPPLRLAEQKLRVHHLRKRPVCLRT